MNCDKSLKEEVNMGHPWANSPQTIGSLTLMYLTIIFTRHSENEISGYDESQIFL